MSTIHIGVINVSDRAAAGVYDDVPGKAVVATLREYLTTEFEPVYRVIPDVPYCIDLIEGPRLETDEAVIRAFRPRS